MPTKFHDYRTSNNYSHPDRYWIVKLLLGQKAQMTRVPQWLPQTIFLLKCHLTPNKLVWRIFFLSSMNNMHQNSQKESVPFLSLCNRESTHKTQVVIKQSWRKSSGLCLFSVLFIFQLISILTNRFPLPLLN